MPYDPYGAFGRGFGGGLGYLAQFRQLQQEQELAPLRKEILLLNLERARQQTAEQRELPALLSQVYRARYQPAVPSQDVGEMPGGAIPPGTSLADLRRTMQGKETFEDVMGAIGPEQFATLQRIAPYALEGLVTREQAGERERKKEAATQARMYAQAGFTAFKEGRAVEGLASFAQSQILLGQKPDTHELGAAIKTEKDRELWNDAVKRLGPLGEKVMMGDDREAAGELIREAWALPPSLDKLREYTLNLAGRALERAGDPRAAQGVKRYHELRAAGKSEMEAWNTIERETPGIVQAMEKAKIVPKELEIATKRAAQRPTGEDGVKTMQHQANKAAETIAKREGLGPEHQVELASWFYGLLVYGQPKDREDLDKKVAEWVAKKRGTPPVPLSDDTRKELDKAWSLSRWFQETFGPLGPPGRGPLPRSSAAPPERPTGPAPSPAPGRPAGRAAANPPTASPTERDAITEARRLKALGLSDDQILEAMELAGWRFED